MRPTPFRQAISLAARAVALGGGLALAGPSWSEDAARCCNPGEPLTIEHLVTSVLRANPGLEAAEAAAAAAAHQIASAGALDDPILSYGTAPRASEQSIDFSQHLPWPGTLAARERAARHRAEAAGWHVGSQRLALTAAAKSEYAEWYYVARAFEIHHEVEALLEELIATAETRYAAGRASQQDVLQAEVESAAFEAHELELERRRAQTLARINALLNRPPGMPLPPAAPISADVPTLGLEALGRLALERHPALKGLEAEIDAAGSDVTLARKAFFPSFQVSAGYDGMWAESDMRPMVGVSISIPFNRSKRQADLERAQAERRRAESVLGDERARLLAEVARARAEVVEAVETIRIYEERLVPLAADYLEAALADYQSGSGAFLSVITAEQQRLSTALALERLRADYLRRVADLELLSGGPLDVPAPADRGGEE